MQWYDVLKYIVIIVVMLGVLISLHELGHLITAKIFHVYCFDYSIGFGPAIIHTKKKNAETYFSLRVIPLGGFVTMYGEPGAVPEGMEEPPIERSLNSIHKGKKAVILSAGIITNFILGFILIGISSFAFPQYYYAYGGYQSETVSINYVHPEYSDQALEYLSAHMPADAQAKEYIVPLVMYGANIPILDSEVYLYSSDGVTKLEEEPRVAVYYPSSLIEARPSSDFIRLYPVLKNADGTIVETTAAHKELGIKYYPNTEQSAGYLNYASDTFQGAKFTIHPHFIRVKENMKTSQLVEAYKNESLVPTNELTYAIENKTCKDVGMKMPVIKSWNGWDRGWQDWGKKTLNAYTAIGQGLASLFTPGGIKNLSGIVGMTAALPTVEATGGWSNIFFFAGLLSINLGVFNLLPFPGLDGWQLLTTAVEGISRKKIPARVQGIVSLIGMALLFALAAFILVKDIIGLF